MYMGLAYFVYTFMRVAIGDSKSPEESPLPEILSQKPGQEEQTYTWKESARRALLMARHRDLRPWPALYTKKP